jgi:Zn-dependent protease with chaperone function
MSIASIRFATHARTWLLIAGPTALLIGIGALIGGAFLYLFAGLAAAMNIVAYWFSDRFALKTGRARQPIGTTGCGDPLRDASADRARTPAASARR